MSEQQQISFCSSLVCADSQYRVLMVNVKGRALMKELVFTWAWIDLQRFLFVFQDRGLCVQESDEECEEHKGDVTHGRVRSASFGRPQ